MRRNKEIISEKQVLKSITDFLGYKKLFWWRNNSGAVISNYKGKERMFRFGSKGSPDVFFLKNGTIYGIETKGSKSKQSPEQKEWQTKFEKEGGIYFLCYSLDDLVKRFIEYVIM